jgi:hypothetical protein
VAVKHLTDEEMQAFLDSEQSMIPVQKQHLKTCDLCKQRLQQYKSLYLELGRPPVMRLSKEFEAKILQKTGLLKQADKNLRWFHWVLLAAVFLLSTVICLFVTGFEHWIKLHAGLSESLQVTREGFTNIPLVQHNYNLLLVSILILSAISLFDRIYINRLRKLR